MVGRAEKIRWIKRWIAGDRKVMLLLIDGIVYMPGGKTMDEASAKKWVEDRGFSKVLIIDCDGQGG